MQPTTQTVFEVFQKERRYVVPLYQRSYVWNQDDQWAPLWQDIERQAIKAAFAFKYEKGVGATHFLGAIVLNVQKIVGRGHAISEIIDGQQRLTTLQIFLAALKDYCNASGRELANEIARLTFNPINRGKSEDRFKIWPTNSDRYTFSRLMDCGSYEDVLEQFDVGRPGAQLHKWCRRIFISTTKYGVLTKIGTRPTL